MDDTPSASIGARLRSRREHLGWSLKDIERVTKIRAHYLEALEKDDAAALPAEVYAVGFLRSYARHLGLDADELVSEWRHQRPPTAPVAPAPAPVPERPPSPAAAPRRPPAPAAATPTPAVPPRAPTPAAAAPVRRGARTPGPRRAAPASSALAALVVALLLVLGAIVVLLHHHATPTAAPPAHHRVVHRHHRTATAPVTTSSPPPPAVAQISSVGNVVTYGVTPGPVDLTLQFQGPCWVEVWINGTTTNPYGHTYQSGQSLSLTGSAAVKVLLGNSGVVTAVLNGQSLGTVGNGPVRYLVAQAQS